MTQKQKIRLSLVLYLNYFVHGIGLIILTQNMSALSTEWGTPVATVSYVVSGIGIGRLIAYYLLGSLSDRYGRKGLIISGMLAYAVFFFGIISTHDFHTAYFLTILAGIANSALDSGTYPTFLEMNQSNGAANILIKAAMSVGEFILPIYIGLNENIGGWYGTSFVVTGAVLLINLILVSRTPFPRQSAPKNHLVRYPLFKKKPSVRQLGLLIILSIYGYTSMAVMLLYIQWITRYGTDILKMSSLEAHFLLSLYSAGSIIGVIIIFSLVRRALVRDIRLIVGLNGLSVLILFIICSASNHLLVSVASFLFGFAAAGGVMQVGLNIFSALFPQAKGRVTGIYFSFGSLATFTIPIMTGLLSNISIAAVLRADIVIALISFAIWLIGYRLLSADQASPATKNGTGSID
ncbi:MFS transporter [Sporolactobacillus sp. CPB3-1]|uniref:MFS transporter n=1 Tax=Sporolactobacillus mangiferae TaxID=2940498 RepID=A0ABT0MAJ2_9BACL|nr:MFS transporter [Sporolactobacillus mangiferae]MCL1631294.1 MFS transporter [Sporolactobacillus mangiferae]